MTRPADESSTVNAQGLANQWFEPSEPVTYWAGSVPSGCTGRYRSPSARLSFQ